MVWIAAAATGVAALLAASAAALDALRLGGAAYLIYLGIQRWRQVGHVQAPQPAPLGRMFIQAAQRMGYRNVYSLIGGYKGLLAANWPMAK